MAEASPNAPVLIANFNARFAKAELNDFEARRPLRDEEDLTQIFYLCEWRKVSKSLTLQYAKGM